MGKLSGLLKTFLRIKDDPNGESIEIKTEEPVKEDVVIEPAMPERPVETQVHSPAPEPEPASEPAPPAVEVTLKNKAGVIYAICGSCGSMWNLRDQMSRSKRPEALSHLSCPSCDKPVKIPAQFLAKK